MILIKKIAFLVPVSYLRKFLFADTNIPVSLHNEFRTNWNLSSDILCDLFSESLYLQRIPILPAISLGKEQVNLPIQKLLDLEKSFLITPEGEVIKLIYINQQDYMRTHRSSSFYKFTAARDIDERINTATVLAIRYGKKKIGSNRDQKNIGRTRFLSQVKVHLEPAKRIIDITDKISNRLKDFYFLSYHNPFPFPYTGKINNLQDLIDEIGFLYRKKYDILKPLISGQGLLENLVKIYPKDSKLYITSKLSESMKQELFTPLQKYYDVFEANDFPELAKLRCSQSSIDGIELEILEEGIQKSSLHAINIRFLPLWDYPSDLEDIVKKSSGNVQSSSEGLAYR